MALRPRRHPGSAERSRCASRDGSDQAGNEQGPHVVGTSPTHCATRFMDGFEVEPVGDSGSRSTTTFSAIASPWVSPSRWNSASATTASSMALLRTDFELRILQQGRQRLSREPRQDQKVPSASIRIDAS